MDSTGKLWNDKQTSKYCITKMDGNATQNDSDTEHARFSNTRRTWLRGQQMSMVEQCKRLQDPRSEYEQHSRAEHGVQWPRNVGYKRSNSEPPSPCSNATKMSRKPPPPPRVPVRLKLSSRYSEPLRSTPTDPEAFPIQATRSSASFVNLGMGHDVVVATEDLSTPPPPYSSLDISPLTLEIACSTHVTGSHIHHGHLSYSDPPPSYCELFSHRVRTTVRQLSVRSIRNDIPADINWRKALLLAGLTFPVVGFAVILPISMIAIGITHTNDCPAEPSIPLCLIIGGVVQMVECFIRLANWIQARNVHRRHGNDNNPRRKSFDPCLYIGIICFVVSSVYVYKADPVFKKAVTSGQTRLTEETGLTSSPNLAKQVPYKSILGQKPFCNETTYKFAFWIVTSYYVIIGVCFVGMLVAILSGAYLIFRDQERPPSRPCRASTQRSAMSAVTEGEQVHELIAL